MDEFSNLKNGQAVWYQNKTGDIEAGKILNIVDEDVEIKLIENDKIVETKLRSIYLRSEFPGYEIDDLVNLDVLNEFEVLNSIMQRFKRNKIYTSVGLTLLFVNPYKFIDETFKEDYLNRCCEYARGKPITNLSPHIWTMTAASYRNIFLNDKRQALIVIGESGAGKTESTKLSLKLLTAMGCKKLNLAEKILSCSAVLESFGNAKTIRNDNSSRFGKYVTISLNTSRKIEGAQMTSYLLEKSRIISQAAGERNYHIFYQILLSENTSTLSNLFLNPETPYNYLMKNLATQPNDLKNHEELKNGLMTLGFSSEEIEQIMKTVASVLLIGQIDFDESTFDNDSSCTILNSDDLLNVSNLMALDSTALAKALLHKTRSVGGSVIDSPVKKEECLVNRDSLAKELYDQLFKFLIKKLNTNLTPDFHDENLSIGLLDIFGFEVFKENSFEQLCINFTNEKLSQLFIEYVFKSEAKSFKDEGLESFLKEIPFKDNNDVIQILESPPIGIFLLIDESCQIAGDDLKLSSNIMTRHASNKLIVPNRFFKDKFTIMHSAKGVEYSMVGFRQKNKDEISSTLVDCFKNSKIKFFNRLFNQEEIENPNAIKKKFLGSKFREQINSLMKVLNDSECSFLRCIKPNEEKKKDLFDSKFALQQIRYLGVLDSIRIRKESFPIRILFKSFYSRFFEIEQSFKPPFLYNSSFDFKDFCRIIIENHFPSIKIGERMLLGKTKMFTHPDEYTLMNEKLQEKVYSLT